MKKKVTFNTIVIFVLISIFCVSFIRQELTMNKIQKQIVDKNQELQKLKEDNDKLKKQVDTIQNDEYIENQARERLGMKKSGEKVVIEGSGNNN